jgi:hypothetical protein
MPAGLSGDITYSKGEKVKQDYAAVWGRMVTVTAGVEWWQQQRLTLARLKRERKQQNMDISSNLIVKLNTKISAPRTSVNGLQPIVRGRPGTPFEACSAGSQIAIYRLPALASQIACQ